MSMAIIKLNQRQVLRMIIKAFHAYKVNILKDGGKELLQDKLSQIVNLLNRTTKAIENPTIFHLELP